MKPLEIKKGVFWVGAIDWNKRTFHGHTYTIRNGTTYNAYLIMDDKIALIDGVDRPFTDEMIARIGQITDPRKIDHIVMNHIETDHSGAIPQVLKLCPKAKVFLTEKGREGYLRHYHERADFQVVKTGHKLRIGTRELAFIEAPMIHWPDSMFTYCAEDEILFSNDAFGQHRATSERFADEIDQGMLMDEMAKYYANILWPFSSIISRKIEEIKKMNLSIEMIATSHGLSWRKEIEKPLDAYISWAKNETKNKKVVVVYETMWGSTEKMARRMADALSDSGASVKLFDIAQSDRTEVLKEMLDAKGFIIGSSTHDNDMLPTMAAFLSFLKGLKPKNRVACVFGSYGWSGGAANSIENVLKDAGIEIAQAAFTVKYVPDDEELERSYEYGAAFADIVQGVKAKVQI